MHPRQDAPFFENMVVDVSATSSFEYLKNARIRTNVPDEPESPGFSGPK
jgi:hypothetical protein